VLTSPADRDVTVNEGHDVTLPSDVTPVCPAVDASWLGGKPAATAAAAAAAASADSQAVPSSSSSSSSVMGNYSIRI